jgi:hypothetical protein
VRPAGVDGHRPADGRAGQRGVERELLACGGELGRQVGEWGTGAHHHDEVAGGVLHDARQPAGVEDEVEPFGWGSPVQLRGCAAYHSG